MAKKPDPKIDLEPDAWERFERAVKVVAKSPPQPKKAESKAKKAGSRRKNRV